MRRNKANQETRTCHEAIYEIIQKPIVVVHKAEAAPFGVKRENEYIRIEYLCKQYCETLIKEAYGKNI